MWQCWLSALVGVALVVVALLGSTLGLGALAWLTGIGGAAVVVLNLWCAGQKK